MNRKLKNLFTTAQGAVKKGTVAMLCLVLVSLVIVMSCDKYDDTYPINIETTDYCYTYTTERLKLDTVYLINSLSEWQEFGGLPEDIDFEKYSFVFVMVSSPLRVYQSTTQLIQTSENEYELKIDVLFDPVDVHKYGDMDVAVLVPKLAENAKIKLTINRQEKNPALCLINTEWSWFKMTGGENPFNEGNEYKSIVRILEQNEDGSINYEIFVEDTLFSTGSFQIQYEKGNRYIYIKLPHNLSNNRWDFRFHGEICWKWQGEQSEGLLFYNSEYVSAVVFHYKKIGGK